MAKQCLAFPDIIEWERKFLDSLIRGNEMMGGPPEQLSEIKNRQHPALAASRTSSEIRCRFSRAHLPALERSPGRQAPFVY